MSRKLRCSFCGKDETQVAKLVAGGKKSMFGLAAYICDQCILTAHDIISDPEPPVPAAAAQSIRANKKLIRAVAGAAKSGRLVMTGKA